MPRARRMKAKSKAVPKAALENLQAAFRYPSEAGSPILFKPRGGKWGGKFIPISHVKLKQLIKQPYVATDENPKDAVAGNKIPLHLVPDSIVALAAMGFLEGMHKYGQFNWRLKPVKMSVYLGALDRHVKRLRAGEWADAKTKVPHISSVLACAAIIGDAWLENTLKDDRPPSAPGLCRFMDEFNGQHLAKLFADHKPAQYTIADKPWPSLPSS